jgi:hypothetical protein
MFAVLANFVEGCREANFCKIFSICLTIILVPVLAFFTAKHCEINLEKKIL